jgi:uncharacterized protein
VRVQRDLVIPAGDGVPLLANRFYPADIDQAPLVLLRSPYGRGAALDRMPQLLAEGGYQVLYQSLRGTDGSGGEFDGFTINPADADGTLSWLREQPWFGGALATCGASYLGFAQWELAARDIPEWKIAVIQDAPSEFAHQFMYPGVDSPWATRSVGCRSSIGCFRPTVEPPVSSSACSPALSRCAARWRRCLSQTPILR